MFSLLPKTSLLNLGRFVVNHLLVAIVTLSLVITLNVTAQTGALNPTNPNVEDFLDSPYRSFAKCIREKYGRDGGKTIRELPWSFSMNPFRKEYEKYKVDTIKENCPTTLGDTQIQKVVHCLDGIVLINDFGWNQQEKDRLESCIDVTKNTLGPLRQTYINCIIRAKYNPSTGYLDQGGDPSTLCLAEKEKFSIFPKNILDFHGFSTLMSCLDHNGRRPKFDTNNSTWAWEVSKSWGENATAHCGGSIRNILGLQMTTPYQLSILPGSGDNPIDIPDLNFKPIIIDIPTEQTCWISKNSKKDGPNLQNIWNPGNWLPLMYKCENIKDGRPIPLHPINFIPITIRLFAFITSLLIWLIVLNLVIGVIMFMVGATSSILRWVKNILLGSAAVVIVLIFMYFILYFILSIFQGQG